MNLLRAFILRADKRDPLFNTLCFALNQHWDDGGREAPKAGYPRHHAFFITAGNFFFNEFNTFLIIVSSFCE